MEEQVNLQKINLQRHDPNWMFILTVFTLTHKVHFFSESETENYMPYDYGES